MENKIKTFNIALCCALIFSVLLSFAGFNASCDEIRQKVLRLHIIPNSDSTADQTVKLQVRDEVQKMAEGLLSGCESLAEAEEIIEQNLSALRQKAEETVSAAGLDDRVDAALKETDFDTREYENFTLPAGKYKALCITIGEGRGQNWWCVMFPSACVGAAAKGEIGDTFCKETADIVENRGRYEVRFRAVELFEGLRNTLNF